MTRVRLVLVAFAAAVLVSHSPAASPALTKSASTFVRSQAGSAINWELWGPEIAARAKAENKPVYVYIGSFLSELSRSTTQQIFTQPDNIKYLNEHFVCVIADREEQPDLAAYAQYYLQNVKQTSGWPTHLWLTPELNPYEGGGYLPLTEEWGKTSFSKQARAAGESWANDPATCRAQAKDALGLMAPGPAGPAAPLPAEKFSEASAAALNEKLGKAASAWIETYDVSHTGFGASPKNPEPELLRFLLSREAERERAVFTFRGILGSPLRDPLDGGFFRYATDAAWRVPYLQRTLADQARMALALLDVLAVTQNQDYAAAATDTLNFALRTFVRPDGTFAAAEDATTEDRLGYFLWTEAEIDAVLGPDAPAFKRAFGVKPEGNVPADDDPGAKMQGRNFLARHGTGADAAAELALQRSTERLHAARAKKNPPMLDERATASAHGLLLAALARAGAQLEDAKLRAAADRTFAAIQKNFIAANGNVPRLAGSSAAGGPADYLALALGYREYARAARKPEVNALADKLIARANSQFFNAAQGRYFASAATLPPGIALRVPAAGDSPSAEALALFAGASADQAATIRTALAATLMEGVTPPGDVLLALQAK